MSYNQFLICYVLGYTAWAVSAMGAAIFHKKNPDAIRIFMSFTTLVYVALLVKYWSLPYLLYPDLTNGSAVTISYVHYATFVLLNSVGMLLVMSFPFLSVRNSTGSETRGTETRGTETRDTESGSPASSTHSDDSVELVGSERV